MPVIKRSKRKKGTLLLLTAALIGGLYLGSPYRIQNEIPSAVCVQAECRDLTDYLSLRGTVVEKKRRDLYPQYTSQVLSIAVRQGDTVKKGERLMTLCCTGGEALPVFYTEIRSRLEKLDPSAWAAELPGQATKTGETYDLISPFDGVVMDIYCEEGERLSGILPCIAISDLTRLAVEADISEENSGAVAVGMQCTIDIPSANGGALQGRITSVAPYASSASVLNFEQNGEARVAVTADLSETNGRILPGYSANLRVDLTSGTGIIIPYNCLAQDKTGEYVFTVDQSCRLQKIHVLTGRELADGIEVLSGLQAGQYLIEDPEKYTAGEQVSLK